MVQELPLQVKGKQILSMEAARRRLPRSHLGEHGPGVQRQMLCYSWEPASEAKGLRQRISVHSKHSSMSSRVWKALKSCKEGQTRRSLQPLNSSAMGSVSLALLSCLIAPERPILTGWLRFLHPNTASSDHILLPHASLRLSQLDSPDYWGKQAVKAAVQPHPLWERKMRSVCFTSGRQQGSL